MAWSYDPTEAAPRDQIRGLVADTDTTDPLIQNETITAELARTPNVYVCAWKIAQRILGVLSRRVTRRVSDTQENQSDMFGQYRSLVQQLEQQALAQGGAPYAGGLSLAEHAASAQDSDLVQPAFGRHAMRLDWPGRGWPEDV